jgi:HPt (histidine-containing phosphotransfer) domain-containing protein
MALCQEAGMDDYISKPFKADEFLNITAKWIKKETQETLAAGSKAAIQSRELPDTNLQEDAAEEISCILDRLSESQRIDRVDIYEIYNEFVDMLPDSLNKIQTALDSGSLAEASAAAHTLKGASGTLRLNYLSKCAAELEKQVKAGAVTLCRDMLSRISEYCQANILHISL